MGIVLLHGAKRSYDRSAYLLLDGEAAHGTVIDYRTTHGDEGTSYFATVRVESPSHEDFVFTAKTGGNPRPFSVGARVPVLVDPEHVGRVRINTFGQMWGGAILRTVLGGLILLFSAIGIWGIIRPPADET